MDLNNANGSAERFRLGEIPQPVLDEAIAALKPYVTALGWPGIHIGGGTFVSVNGRFGILTATHVWNKLWSGRDQQPEVQLVVANGPHSYAVAVDHIVPHVQQNRTCDEWGPDIEFLELPYPAVDRIRAAKAFAPLTSISAKMRKVADNIEGFVAITGFPDELSTSAVMNGIPMVTVRGGYVSCISRKVVRNGYDYLETVDDPHVQSLPNSYGGVSGSGLWAMQLRKKAGAPIIEATLGENFALAGVAFFQRPKPSGGMMVRYHGQQSIYDVLPTFVPGR